MKINKLFIALLGMVAITLAACSSDDDYQRATVSGAQVFFPNTVSTVIETPTDANSFTVPVKRVNTNGALTVPLTITQSDGSIYTPAAQQVTFADGSDATTLTFSYDPDDVEYGTYYDITIAIDDENGTPYGITTYQFKAGKTAWVAMKGKATYREDIASTWYSFNNPVYEVEIEQSAVKEGLYRLVNPYGTAFGLAVGAEDEDEWAEDYDYDNDYYIEVDASDPDHVYIIGGELGLLTDGMMSGTSLVAMRLENGISLEDQIANAPGTFGTLKNGVITMPANSLLISEANYNGGSWYYAGSGLFAIALPGTKLADYSLSVTYAGIYTNAAEEAFAVGNVSPSKEIPTLKAIVAAASDDAEAIADAVAAGELEALTVEKGRIEVPIAEGLSGKLQLIVVALDGTDVVNVATAFFEYYGGANPWESLGIGLYTDDFIYPLYNKARASATYEVEVQTNTEVPGVYRLVEPYGEAFPFYEYADSYKSADLEINAEDPEGVYFTEQTTGLDLGNGEMSITSFGGYLLSEGYSMAVLKNYGLVGTLEDGVITIGWDYQYDENDERKVDEDGNYLIMQGYVDFADGTWAYGGMNGEFKVVLPSAVTASARKAAAASRKAADFERRLNGHFSSVKPLGRMKKARAIAKKARAAKPAVLR